VHDFVDLAVVGEGTVSSLTILLFVLYGDVMALRSFLSACICSVVLLSGCAAQYPLGMAEDEWKALPENQKLEARMQQSKLDEADRQRRAEEKKQKAQMKQEREMAHLAYVDTLHTNGHYGDVLQCVVRDPVVDFHPGWRAAVPFAFSIAKSEVKSVTMSDRNSGRTARLWLKYSQDGMRLTLCRHKTDHKVGKACDALVSTYAGFMNGHSHTLNLPDLMRGTIKCGFGPGKGMPKTMIIHRR